MDMAKDNEKSDKKVLLQLMSYLERPTGDYRQGDSMKRVMQALRTQYATMMRQAKEKLMSVRKDPQDSVFHLTVDIRRLVYLAHPYIPYIPVREPVTVDYIIHSLGNQPIERHLLLVDASILQQTVDVIEDYMAISGCNRPVCRAIGKHHTTSHLKN